MPYESPGAAASQGIFDFLAQHQKAKALQRQQDLEALRLQHEITNSQEEHAIKMQEMQAQAQFRQQQADEKAKAETMGSLEDRFQMGDVLDPNDPDVLKARQLGILPHVAKIGSAAPTVGALATPPGMTSPGIPVKEGLTPELGGPVGIRFLGSDAQRKEAKADASFNALLATIPDGPPKEALRIAHTYEKSGHPLPAGVIEAIGQMNTAAAKPDVPVFQMNKRTGTMEQVGTVPANAKIEAQQFPPTVNVTNGPQPQIFYGPNGEPHAIQFSGGQSREIPMPAGMNDLTKTNPITAQMRTRIDAGQRVGSHIPEIRAEIDAADKAGVLGPALGRFNEFMAGTLGSTGDPAKDQMLGKLRADLSLLKSGTSMVHSGARGAGVEVMKRFDELLSSKSMSKDMLLGGLSSFQGWLGTYAKNPAQFYKDTQEDTTPATGGGPAAAPAPAASGWVYQNGKLVKKGG